MRDRILRGLLLPLGAAALLIGASIFLLGAHATAAATEWLVDMALGLPFDGGEPFTPTTDSELRFYAPLWMAYGAALIWTALDLPARRAWVLPLAALFLAGGLGRALSWLAEGPPRLPFVILMGVEIVVPVLIAVVGYRGRGRRGG